MKKREFKKATPEEQYEFIRELKERIDSEISEAISLRNDFYTTAASISGQYSDVGLNAFSIDVADQQNKTIKKLIASMNKSNKEAGKLIAKAKKHKAKLAWCLVEFFNLNQYQEKFSLDTRVKDDTISVYVYQGSSIEDDKYHGHFGINLRLGEIFIRNYGDKNKTTTERFKPKTYFLLALASRKAR